MGKAVGNAECEALGRGQISRGKRAGVESRYSSSRFPRVGSPVTPIQGFPGTVDLLITNQPPGTFLTRYRFTFCVVVFSNSLSRRWNIRICLYPGSSLFTFATSAAITSFIKSSVI